MNDNEVFTYHDGTATRHKLQLRQCRPVGWAELETSGTVSGLLGQLGAERLPRRYPVHFVHETRNELIDRLSRLAHRSPYFDRAWILLNARWPDNTPTGGFVAMLSRAQLFESPQSLGRDVLVLDNGQILEPINPSDSSPATLERQGANYVNRDAFLDPSEDELVLVTTPSTPFFDRIRTRHSYYCLLNPAYRQRINTDYVAVRNLFLGLDYPDLHAAVPLRVIFDPRVPDSRIVLDSTTLFAIGLPQGEPVGLATCNGRASRIRNAVFGSRHTIARVGRCAVIDIEKPVTRLPEEMFDLLGLASGHRVIVEAVAYEPPLDRRVTRMSLRALPWRERSPLLVARSQTGVLDNQQLVGDEDFPQISLDLATRDMLGVSPGSAVYVRPAVSSLLVREFTSVSIILAAAIFSAAALQSIPLAIASASIYVIFALFTVGARLR